MSLPEADLASGRASGSMTVISFGVRLSEGEARERFAAVPVVRLGTADGQGGRT